MNDKSLYGAVPQWAALAAIGTVASFALQAVSFPAPFLMGFLCTAIGFSVFGVRLRVWPPLMIGVQATIGCVVARSIDAETLLSILQDWQVLTAMILVTLVIGILVAWLFVRYGSLPGATAAWGFSPGGATIMVLMARHSDADIRIVGLMQYLRILIVVLIMTVMTKFLFDPGTFNYGGAAANGLFAVPMTAFLETVAVGIVGALITRRFRIPSGAVLMPLLIGGALQTFGVMTIAVPWSVIDLSYALTGCYIGLTFNRDVFFYALRALPQIILGTLLIIVFSALLGGALTLIWPIDPFTAYLATTPGGIDVVVIIALGTHANLPFITTAQTFRILFYAIFGPPLARALSRYQLRLAQPSGG